MHLLSLMAPIFLCSLVLFANAKPKDGKGKPEKDPEKINQGRGKEIEKSLVNSGVFSEMDMKEAKKLQKCIRKESAAKNGRADPDDDDLADDDIIPSLSQLAIAASAFENCQSLVHRGRGNGRSRRQVLDWVTYWPDAKLYYKFDNGFTSEQKQKVVNALKGISDRTCIKFIQSTAQTGAIIKQGPGCSSSLGKLSGSQVIHLQDDSSGTCMSTMHMHVHACGTCMSIQHEFIHALGVHHEHTRVDRDEFVTINFDNIIAGKEGNFKKCDPCKAHVTTYDYGSVMHYGRKSFHKNGLDTITPKTSSVTIGQRNGVSDKDIELLNNMYCTATPPPLACGNCLTTGHGTGCGNAEVQTCVCNADSWCCDEEWDGLCVNQVEGSPCNLNCA